MSSNRRTVLRIGAATGATILTGGLAGCTGGLTTSYPGYADWLHDPDEVGDGDYSFTFVSPRVVRENEDRFDDFLTAVFGSAIESALGDTGVDLDEVSTTVWPGAGAVFEADFDRDRVVDDLTDAGYEEASTVGGGTVYATGDENRFAGVLDGTLVTASSGLFSDVDPVDVVEGLVETGAGEVDRYQDVDEDVAELLGHLESGYYVSGGPDGEDETTFDDQAASAAELSLADSYSEVRLVYAFEEESDTDAERVQEWVRENENTSSLPIDLYEVSATTSGRSVLVDARAETDEIFG